MAAQIAAIDNFIQAGYDAIAFIAVNPTAFDAVIKRAKKAGTVLVSFDNPVDSPEVLRITPEWIEFEGAIKAQSVVDQMKEPKGKILEIRGIQGNSTDRDRHIGVQKVLVEISRHRGRRSRRQLGYRHRPEGDSRRHRGPRFL